MDLTGDTSIKSFWKRPEGITGTIFVLGLIGFAGWGAFLLLPFIITLLENIITAALLFIVVVLLASILMQRRFYTLISMGFKMLMRMLTNVFVPIFLIDILKEGIKDAKKYKEQYDREYIGVEAEEIGLEREISQYKQEMTIALSEANEATRPGEEDLQNLKLGEAENRRAAIERAQPKLDNLRDFRELLGKYSRKLDITIREMSDQLNMQIREYKALERASKAIKAAKKILAGAGDEQDLYDIAKEKMAEKCAQDLAEIRNFMRTTAPIIKGMDVKDRASITRGHELLKQWKENPNLIIQSSEKSRVPATVIVPSQSTNKFLK